MYSRQLILLICMLSLCFCKAVAQQMSYEEANAKSYELYEKSDWKGLLEFGKSYLKESPDFVLLRLRLGYAAFMLGNFSEALKQYDAVLQKDSYNETAHYYSWLCRKYLNQPEQAAFHLKYFSKESKAKEKIESFGITKLGTEVSLKNTQLSERGNGIYARLDLCTRIGSHITMQHSGALYNQTIGEPKLLAVINNNNIAINQKEYYNKTTISLNRHWQLLGGYHYLYTPFNNFIYNNQLGLVGLRYNHHYFSLQADVVFGNITDTSQTQFNATATIYPGGNLNLYSISTSSIRKRNSSSIFNFKQVLGAKLLKFLWIEGNITAGSFSNYSENDALYVYNAIDRNKMKAGVTGYFTLSNRVTAQLGYTYEKREVYKSSFTFNQHSITGGISCQF